MDEKVKGGIYVEEEKEEKNKWIKGGMEASEGEEEGEISGWKRNEKLKWMRKIN